MSDSAEKSRDEHRGTWPSRWGSSKATPALVTMSLRLQAEIRDALARKAVGMGLNPSELARKILERELTQDP